MVDTIQPRSLSCFRIRKRRHENRMDLRRAKTQESLNMTWAGKQSEQPRSFRSPATSLLLTFPFIEPHPFRHRRVSRGCGNAKWSVRRATGTPPFGENLRLPSRGKSTDWPTGVVPFCRPYPLSPGQVERRRNSGTETD